ncbi:MAG: monovalent cation/H(+) antiporter subunit G, partial [Phycisphaerae bacterium]|nr:monovalent cation/H(+) antiporter subunit G [Phycisphaerae bacterium]
ILVGVAVRAFGLGVWPMGIKAILCAGFVLLTSPVAAHAICRGAYISGVKLWQGSVEDEFASRAEDIRSQQQQEGTVQSEEAEAS